MISRLTPDTRRFLINCRCRAMRHGGAPIVRLIDERSASSASELPVLDQVALALLKAEILYLDCREAEALEVFRTSVDPQLDSLPQEVRFAVGQNRRDVAWGTAVGEDVFRQAERLYDQRQLAGVQLWDPQAMVRAYEAATGGRHYEALPTLWRELANSYHQLSWLHYRQASRRMVKEFLQLGWAYSADFYVLEALDLESAKVIADHLIRWRRPQLIEQLVQRLLSNANLKRHAAVACELLALVADGVPDSQIHPVARWLLPWCSIAPAGRSELRLVTSAWDAVQSFVPRMGDERAREITQAATEHPSWNQDDHLREHLVRAVDDCVGVLSPDEFSELVGLMLPLAASLPGDLNYDEDILDLLRHLAFRGDDNIKRQIGDALYPDSGVNLELIRIAQEFGKQIDADDANRMAENFAQDVRLQVQHLAPGEEFRKPAISLGTLTARSEERTVAVSMYSNMGLRAVAAHRSLLRPETIRVFIEALLEMIREPENSLPNKVDLINGIIELADSATPEMAELIYGTLSPLAAGEVVGLDVTAAAGDPNHPLNPFKVNLGNPATVQGGALFALASIERHRSGVYGPRLNQLLEQAMSASNNEVRRLAFLAARQMPELTAPSLMRVLIGTRDEDPAVAEAAFQAVYSHLRETEEFWHLLIYSLTLASESIHANIRRAAAFIVNNLHTRSFNEEIANKIQGLRVKLGADLCHSVRSQISNEVAT